MTRALNPEERSQLVDQIDTLFGYSFVLLAMAAVWGLIGTLVMALLAVFGLPSWPVVIPIVATSVCGASFIICWSAASFKMIRLLRSDTATQGATHERH